MSEAIEKTQPSLTREQIDLVKMTVAKGATDLELRLFLNQCQRTGLDPLSRQIHFIKRRSESGFEQGTIQTGIDGYRSIADRTGDYAGSDDAVFVENQNGPGPESATVTVHKMVQGQKCSFTATARWSEYYPGEGKQGFFWRKMPYGQLAKCAEALALRKAFPQQLSGVYTHEEMQQAGPEVLDIGGKVVEANSKEAAQAVADAKIAGFNEKHAALKTESEQRKPDTNPFTGKKYDGKVISDKQMNRMFAIAHKSGWTDVEIKKALMDGWKVEHPAKIPAGKSYEDICTFFEGGGKPPEKDPDAEFAQASQPDDENLPF